MNMSRVFAISDIHVDHEVNAKWIDSWPDDKFKDDVLLIAGDVTDNLPLLEWTLSNVKKKFKSVFYVPGNYAIKLLIYCNVH